MIDDLYNGTESTVNWKN